MHRVVKLWPRLLCSLTVAATLLMPATGFAGEDGDEDAPTAGAVSVTALGADSARVAGTVQLGKGPALYWFEYGSTPALGERTAAGTATHEDDDKQHQVLVARALSGLAPGTPYYVRLVASSDSGRSDGPVATFATDARPATRPTPSPGEPPPAPPAAMDGAVLGERFVAVAARGSVRVRLPGADHFMDLPQVTAVPVGTVVDARRGTLAMTAALPGGAVQHARFGGGRFRVRQRATGEGRTDLYLRGGGFGRCRRAARSVLMLATAARKRPRPVRRLWGRDEGGRFRTHGRDSVATVRGTRWTVVDRCDGTLTRVSDGSVDVRERRTGRTVRVRAGERHFAPHRP
jgi:hypothetical protein